MIMMSSVSNVGNMEWKSVRQLKHIFSVQCQRRRLAVMRFVRRQSDLSDLDVISRYTTQINVTSITARFYAWTG